ncbi:DUF4272 domain-containing protein [Clostridium cellulovorans]|uniref:Uncharacterized protein n=1 Tax=Clostridium cellulovorans (strain ATCC 35296 / DSM 3052 / OCM 3 / 743B) TaxID=573061 RepID=D9SP75_CLOC7|nr:DUF4272 domain-containing protein [Clostridium cellulovorans]ADL52040.1 hypothetical protein Clocel_2319 [Clostridium cellulovorans 743B]
MKKAKEIIARSVILLCVSDRCALEKSTIGGRAYSKKQREEQRIAIYKWQQNNRYTDFMTKNEKLLFEQEVGSGNKNEILSIQVQYETIEPCLWTIGLVKKLSSYNQFVLDDFHPVLQIGMNHTLERLLDTRSLQANEDIQLQNEISMLWHWRAVECNNSIFKLSLLKTLLNQCLGINMKKF